MQKVINEIPKTTRYEKIMKTVYDFLISEQIEFFPIDPIYIINKNKWGLITYSELAKTHQVSIQDIIKAYQSEDGYVILDSNNYTIAYNDTIKSKERIRFTLMHEIGHIKLNHLEDFDETILLRSNLTKQQYDVLEREAHAFARNTLAPAIVVRKLESLRNKPITFFDIKSNFFVSKKASEIRMTMLEWDTKHSTNYEKHIDKFTTFFNNLLHGKQCVKCKHYFFLKKSVFCPICGYKRHYKLSRGESNMIYNGFALDNDMRVTQCPKCNNEEVGGNYCKICSTYLFNKCTGIDPNDNNDYYNQNIKWGQYQGGCDILLEGNARICHECGSTSSFFEDRLLRYWNETDDNGELVNQEGQYEDVPLPF